MESKQCDAECKVTLQDFQIKLDQFCAEMRQSMDEMKKTMTQMSEEQCKSAVDKPNVNLIQDIQTKLEDNSTTPDYNILLLGESGSGKSLFINSFASYIHHDQLGDALSAPPTQCIIPTTVVTTKNHQEKQIHFGMANKSQAPGRLETTVCTTYEFQLDNLLVRLIDSPGIGGPGQVTDNKTLLDSILNFVSRCEFKVNSLAIVAKSNQSQFDCQLHEVFNRLRCHVDNVLFLLTHSGDTDYRPGDVMQPFNELFKDSPINVKPSKENTYCFDNKGFRYMLMNQSGHGSDIEFEESYEDAWETSAEEFYRLIQHLANSSHSTRGIIAPPIEHLSATIEARRYSECCSHFINATVDIISEIYREQISLREKFTLFKLLKLEIKPEFSNAYKSKILECTSKSCPKLQQVPTWADVNKRVVICCKWFCISWGNICNECGCRVNTHVIINIAEEIEQCKEKIIELQRTKEEWKAVKNVAAQLNMMSKAKMVRSTDSKTDVGQGGGDHKEETVTLANVFQLKKKLLDLPIYGPQLKEHFSKYT